jgi:hypothetical protein
MNATPENTTENSVAVRKIIWRDIFPWLILVRVFRVAVAPGPLMLSTAAVAICSLGWWVSGFLFLPKEDFKLVHGPSVLAQAHMQSEGMWKLRPYPEAVRKYLPDDSADEPYWRLSLPAMKLFQASTPFPYVVYYLVGFLITAAVWGFVGGIITRQALVILGCEQEYDWLDAARFVVRRYLQYFLAPIAPMLAIVAMGLLIVPLGWLMNVDFGVFIAGLLWIFVIALGLIAAWLIVGLVFGWPLMYGVIGSKRDGDALQAFSDSFSYVYGKPLHLLWYTAVALTLGGLALYVVNLFAVAAIEFGYWGASWGAGAQKIAAIRRDVDIVQGGGEITNSTMHEGGVELISLVMHFVQVIQSAVAYSYFFVSAAAIFLLMRYAVDEKEMDEVHLEEEEEQLETARRAMLSEQPAEVPPAKEPPPVYDPPAATVAFDTAAPAVPPPAVNSTEISTPENTTPPTSTPEKPPGSDEPAP